MAMNWGAFLQNFNQSGGASALGQGLGTNLIKKINPNLYYQNQGYTQDINPLIAQSDAFKLNTITDKEGNEWHKPQFNELLKQLAEFNMLENAGERDQIFTDNYQEKLLAEIQNIVLGNEAQEQQIDINELMTPINYQNKVADLEGKNLTNNYQERTADTRFDLLKLDKEGKMINNDYDQFKLNQAEERSPYELDLLKGEVTNQGLINEKYRLDNKISLDEYNEWLDNRPYRDSIKNLDLALKQLGYSDGVYRFEEYKDKREVRDLMDSLGITEMQLNNERQAISNYVSRNTAQSEIDLANTRSESERAKFDEWLNAADYREDMRNLDVFGRELDQEIKGAEFTEWQQDKEYRDKLKEFDLALKGLGLDEGLYKFNEYKDKQEVRDLMDQYGLEEMELTNDLLEIRSEIAEKTKEDEIENSRLNNELLEKRIDTAKAELKEILDRTGENGTAGIIDYFVKNPEKASLAINRGQLTDQFVEKLNEAFGYEVFNNKTHEFSDNFIKEMWETEWGEKDFMGNVEMLPGAPAIEEYFREFNQRFNEYGKNTGAAKIDGGTVPEVSGSDPLDSNLEEGELSAAAQAVIQADNITAENWREKKERHLKAEEEGYIPKGTVSEIEKSLGLLNTTGKPSLDNLLNFESKTNDTGKPDLSKLIGAPNTEWNETGEKLFKDKELQIDLEKIPDFNLFEVLKLFPDLFNNLMK